MVTSTASSSLLVNGQVAWSGFILWLLDRGDGVGGTLLRVQADDGVRDILHVTHDGVSPL